jgi:glutathione S-transferase
MPFKLVYFPVRGRAQALRYMCLDNDIQLEEEVVQMADWASLKAKTPLGQLPVFHDGKLEIGQSNAILRYVARKHGLYGKNDNEATLIDMLNDQQEDVRLSYLRLIYQQYDTEKDNYIKSIPEKLAVFEKFLKKNNDGTGFFVGSQISFVDYTIFDLLDNLLVLSPTSLDTFPLLKAFHGRISTHEKLARYRQTDAFKKLPINGNSKQ